MNHDSLHLADLNLAQKCCEADEPSIALLLERFGAATGIYLMRAGARPEEAREVVGSLWADLLASAGDRPLRLLRYDGSCALQTWLNTVALNKLLTRKRTEQRWQRLAPLSVSEFQAGQTEEREPGWLADPGGAEAAEAPLIEIMRTAIEEAFLACDPEDFVVLQLAHCDGLHQAELGTIFGCDASVISRRLKKAQEKIAAATLSKIRQTDPWLDLQWEDFTELCRAATPACFGLD